MISFAAAATAGAQCRHSRCRACHRRAVAPAQAPVATKPAATALAAAVPAGAHAAAASAAADLPRATGTAAGMPLLVCLQGSQAGCLSLVTPSSPLLTLCVPCAMPAAVNKPARMSPEERRIIKQMHDEQNMTPNDIAKLLGRHRSAVGRLLDPDDPTGTCKMGRPVELTALKIVQSADGHSVDTRWTLDGHW